MCLSKLLEQLKITREQLVEMGILIGTDFFEGIKGIGQHKALELIQKYGTIETMVKEKISIGKTEIDVNLEMVNQIKDIFLKPDVKKDYPRLKWDKIQFEKIEELLVEQHNFSENRVKNALERLRKADQSSVQTSLDKFFKK